MKDERRTYYVYILTNRNRRLYIGMTNDLYRRIKGHQTGQTGLAAFYKMTKLCFQGPG
ncbi:GIY-YIG nuclease family protein [bacterium]|nr:GIY-YIG nuclease family protein [bacterium]